MNAINNNNRKDDINLNQDEHLWGWSRKGHS